MRRRNSRGVAMLIAGVALLFVVWQFQPPQYAALYDGICVPAAYQYLSPPPGASPAPAPQAATQQISVNAGVQETTEVLTAEPNAPQAQLIIDQGTFTVPPGVTSLTGSITPVPPPAALPTDGTLDSNVYDFRVTAGSTDLTPTSKVTIVLGSATVDSTPRAVEQYTGSGWQRLQTSPIMSCTAGYGSFGVSTKSLGRFAVVKLGAAQGGTTPPPPPAGNDDVVLVVFGIVAILALGAGLLLMRRRR